MLSFEKFSISDKLIVFSKISIIFIVGIFLIGFFFPFYEYPNDSKVYGFQSLWMSEGKYEYTNDFLESSGKWEFVPAALIKTQYNTAIPNILPVFPALGSIVYNLFGMAGLFYLNPILSILLLILSERIASKFFGKYVGLLTLIFLATNEMVFWIGRALLTDTLFSILFLLGSYFLINYIKEKKIMSIVLASSFFAATSFIRPNGIIFVPIEILIIIGFFIIKSLYNRKKSELKLLNFNYLKQIKFRKVISLTLVTISPWGVFVIFMLSFNAFYFGDPTITIYNVPGAPQHFISEFSVDKFGVDVERIDKYSRHFLPYPLNRASDILNSNIAEQNDSTVSDITKILPNDINLLLPYLGIFTFMVLGLSLLFSFKTKSDFEKCVVYCVLILSLILFYSLNFIVVGRQGSPRDMLPIFPIFYMLLSYLIVSFLSLNIKNVSSKRFILKSSKIFLIIILIIFIPISFYFADYSQIIKKDGFIFKDPNTYELNYPHISDSLNEKDIVVTIFKWDQVIFHPSVPFTPIGIETQNNLENPEYIKMVSTLKDIILEGNPVYVFKDPGLPEEKNFQIELVQNDFVLKNYSTTFCKIELQTESMKKSDVECL